MNLLSNAFKFTFEGEIEVRVESTGDRALLTVSDTGAGISEDELIKIFDRFHRVEGVKARTHEGSGIGLALVRELVQMHGGDINAQSRPGGGTTFSVTLPFGRAHLPPDKIMQRQVVAPAASRFAAYIEEAIQWLPGEESLAVQHVETRDGSEDSTVRILLVDDNADMREYLARLLRVRWTVETATDGLEALAAIRRNPPTLVITDVMMPGLDGFGLIRALRSDSALMAIPVIMLSARAGEEARVEGLEAGADDYVIKPFTARELIARVATRIDLYRLRARLNQERATIADILRQALVPVAIFRGKDLIHEMANSAFVESIGNRQVVGRPLLEVVPEIRGQGIDETLTQVMETGIPSVGRELLLKLERNGKIEETYWTFVCTPLRGESSKVESVIAICNEVTREVLARQSLELLARDADAANRTKDQFLAMLGHELRNPLSPIVTALQLMRLQGKNSREQDVIERQVAHLTRLVDDLLDVSRITTGKIELRKRRTELASLVSSAVETVSLLMEQRRQEMKIEVPREGLVVDADEDRMAQVISNLLENAVKYGDPRSPIEITASREGSWIELRVKDRGIGIAPEKLNLIFEPFVQQPQGLARSSGGLGLGLPIARRIVEMHGGTITAHSGGRGMGSEFVIDLPPASGAVEEPEMRALKILATAHTQEVGRLGARVLVVDDNQDTADVLQRLLQSLGCTVEVALDGPSALKAVRTFQPSIALVDIGLPVMDGYELAPRLREVRDLRLIAITGYGQKTDKRRARDAGFDMHVVKPIDLTKLERIMQDLIPQRRGEA